MNSLPLSFFGKGLSCSSFASTNSLCRSSLDRLYSKVVLGNKDHPRQYRWSGSSEASGGQSPESSPQLFHGPRRKRSAATAKSAETLMSSSLQWSTSNQVTPKFFAPFVQVVFG